MSRTSAVVSILVLAVLASVAAYAYSIQSARLKENRTKVASYDETLADITAEIAAMKGQLAALRASETETQRALGEYKRRKGAKPMSFIADVVSCDSKAGEVVLSIGSLVGLEQGTVFTIYRDTRAICNIRVDNVLEATSVALVIPESIVSPDYSVMPGDTARAE